MFPSDFVERMSPQAIRREMRLITKVTKVKKVNSEDDDDQDSDSFEDEEMPATDNNGKKLFCLFLKCVNKNSGLPKVSQIIIF